MDEIQKNLATVNASIRQAAIACGRNIDNIHLVTVSKTVKVDMIRKAIEAGVTILGENYVQEARDKIRSLGGHDLSWHFIGHLQTNKARIAVRLFDLIHTVDSFKLAQELNKQAGKIGKCQNILVQVKIGKERSKSGVDPANAIPLIKDISRFENLMVKGLMTMPPFFNDPEKTRPYFSELRRLQERINAQTIPHIALSELSMGMTGDFKIAIGEGATLVRIGTAIFGKRE
jgi:pyridoxal phosphate enzyme (YggS family)